MADNSGVTDSAGKPVKSILKKGHEKHAKPVFVVNEEKQSSSTGPEESAVQWDEMNILMTEHPENKDYGHMKIEEPKTPYHEMMDDEQEEVGLESAPDTALSPDDLAKKVSEAAAEGSSTSEKWEPDSSSGSEEDSLTEEQRKHKAEFKAWRKKHYNEFFAVKRAKELIAKDLAEAEEDNSSPVQISVSSPSPMQSTEDDVEEMQQDPSQT